MTFDSALFDPTALVLDIPDSLQTQAWQQSQASATSTSHWTAYLNQLCTQVFLSWLRSERTTRAQVWPNAAALPSFWESVNGTALTLGNTRLILIPEETADLDELRVPQEWVDISSWAGNYYLAIQVDVDERFLHIWGYCTHQQLKTTGTYDGRDRTYSLRNENLITDLNVLWVALDLCPDETTQAALSPLPSLTLPQAESLLQRLGTPDVLRPRLAVPFERWGALLAHGGWRQRLAERRRGLPEQRSILQWFQGSISDLAQQLGWERMELQPSLVGARGEGVATPAVAFSRQLEIAGQTYELQIFPLADAAERTWRFALLNLMPGGRIPGGFVLRLLTEDMQPFDNNEDRAATAVDQLFVDVTLEPGEGLVWQVEPAPDDYDVEILRF